MSYTVRVKILAEAIRDAGAHGLESTLQWMINEEYCDLRSQTWASKSSYSTLVISAEHNCASAILEQLRAGNRPLTPEDVINYRLRPMGWAIAIRLLESLRPSMVNLLIHNLETVDGWEPAE